MPLPSTTSTKKILNFSMMVAPPANAETQSVKNKSPTVSSILLEVKIKHSVKKQHMRISNITSKITMVYTEVT